jgi:LytS/YehU family sensor histidine kinase
VNYYVVVPWHYPDLAARYYQVPFFHPPTMLTFLLSLYSVVAYAGVILFVWKWYENEKAKQVLSKEKLEAELRFLKAQIHPHFLFNMLNNVYALSLKKSNATPAIILKISSLLDYMLYKSNANSVLLRKEVELIRDYLELERLRYGDRITIALHTGGEADGHRIAPLILFPFVENCFKHGVSAELEKGWINLSILVQDDMLRAKIENSKARTSEPDRTGESDGIGFKNALRRLELLYPGRYTLDAVDKGSRFVVELSVKLRPYPEVQRENPLSARR